jgi:predicted dienelactone hydrolase
MRLIGLALAAVLLVAAPAWAGDVGFEQFQIANPDGKPFTIGVWYPTEAKASAQPLETFTQDVALDAPVAGGRRLALVVMSHGSGGSFAGHYDTALALAKAGFVAAAITHEGDSYDDQTRVVQIWRRPAQLKRLVDFMLVEWSGRDRIDPARIGAFGFSAGGFTVLVAAGGTPDLSATTPYCAGHAKTFTCQIIAKGPADVQAGVGLPASAWIHDARIRAIVAAAPALGFAFGKSGLKDVRVPVQLWRAEFDHVLPSPDYADAVNADLPVKPEFHVAPNADHYDFIAPCSEGLAQHAPDICQERPGFDRAAFHASFDTDVVSFFKRTLK